jgi:hypothetical protein
MLFFKRSDIKKEDGVIRRSLAILAVAAAVLVSQDVLAQDHVVGAQDLSARLAAAESARQRNLATVDRFLASSEVSSAAASIDTDVARLRDGIGALGDAELADLAARVDALGIDPVAGLDQDIRTLLIIFLIVAIVILVLQAVD